MNPSIARRLWQLFEPYHACVYFAPEVKDVYAEAGTKGYWMGYFASRSAALGPVGASVVTATFFGFAPDMVARAIPDAWSFTTPERILTARRHLADVVLRRLLGDVSSDTIAEAADLATSAVAACDPAGRPLFAAHAALPLPDEPHLRLWHAATCLREHRGDGHVALLVGAGLDGCEANALAAAARLVPRDRQASLRGWTPQQWAAAEDRLRERGFVDREGEMTLVGAAARDAIEVQTDVAALRPWQELGDEGADRLTSLLEPLVKVMAEKESMPFPNPVGVPRPV